jgi:hypothetical protein
VFGEVFPCFMHVFPHKSWAHVCWRVFKAILAEHCGVTLKNLCLPLVTRGLVQAQPIGGQSNGSGFRSTVSGF